MSRSSPAWNLLSRALRDQEIIQRFRDRTLPESDPPVTLVNSTVLFHTNNEDKDYDTYVTITVYDENNTLCAIIADDLGHFNDNSTTGPYGLNIINPSSKESLQRGKVMIHIDPNGHDTWRLNFVLDLAFSNGDHFSCVVNNIELTQDLQDQTFGISGIIRT